MANNKDISSTIRQTIQQAKSPAIFFISDFPDFGYEYVRKVLSSMVAEGELMRLANGIYLKPQMTQFGPLQPTTDAVVEAITAHDAAKVLPTGATAENMLGLSEQVPMNLVYLTNGSSRVIQLGAHTIKLKRVVPKYFAIENRVLAILCLAMKSIGEQNISDEQMSRIRQIIALEKDKADFSHDVQLMPLWINRIITSISKENL